MFHPAGFSDSDESQEGFSSNRRCYSSDEEQKPWTLRRPSQNTAIPWDTVNNNNQEEVMVSSMSTDAKVSDPSLGPVMEKTKKYLRSTLLSHKGGVEMFALNNDYYEMVGEKIPYQKLNYNSLESFLRALPSVCSIRRCGGEVIVSGVAGEASQHIQNMVAMQKATGKSRKRGKGKKSARYGGQSNYDREMDSWHRQFAPPPARTKKAPPPAPRKLCTAPAPARTTSKQLNCPQMVKTVKAEQGSKVTEKAKGALTRDLVLCGKRVRELLKGRLHGLYIAQLEKLYEKKFSENLPQDWTQELNAAGDIIVVKEEGGLLLVKCGEGSTAPPTSNDNPDDGVSAKIEETSGLKDRVLQLLQGRVYGLLVSQVEKMFFKQWSEKLEGDWVSKLEHLGGVVVDREGEQVVLKEDLNGNKIRNKETCSPLADLDSGVARLDIENNGGRREVVEKVKRMGRVKQILQGRLHGLYAAQVEKLYEKKFGLHLEHAWWSELVVAGSVEVETLNSGQVVIKWTQ